MVVPLSPPLSRQLVSGLCAGDAVVLTGPVLLIRCGRGADEEPTGGWPAETVEGGVCCLVDAPGTAGPGGWQVARIDEVAADRLVRALLATGARGVIAVGQCPATASYAFRKYAGVFFAVGPDWLAAIGHALPPDWRESRRLVAVLELNHAALTVAHDTQGRSVWDIESLRGGLG